MRVQKYSLNKQNQKDKKTFYEKNPKKLFLKNAEM